MHGIAWMIFENTHEPIISKQDFELVQKIRENIRRPQKIDRISPFAGIVYCADCGRRMKLCRAKSLSAVLNRSDYDIRKRLRSA